MNLQLLLETSLDFGKRLYLHSETPEHKPYLLPRFGAQHGCWRFGGINTALGTSSPQLPVISRDLGHKRGMQGMPAQKLHAPTLQVVNAALDLELTVRDLLANKVALLKKELNGMEDLSQTSLMMLRF